MDKNIGLVALAVLLFAVGGCPGDDDDDGASGKDGAAEDGGAGKGGASGDDAAGKDGASGKGAAGKGGASGDGGASGKGGTGGSDVGAGGSGGKGASGSGGEAANGSGGKGAAGTHDEECAAWNDELTALAEDLDCNVEPDGFKTRCAQASVAVNDHGPCFPIWKTLIECLMPFEDKMECTEGNTKLTPKEGVCESERAAFDNASCKNPNP